MEFAGALYHVTSRGNARQDIFLTDRDREHYLFLLSREVRQRRWRCHAYCLMDNHLHLLIETPIPSLSRGMQRLNSAYGQRFNREHGRVGHVLQGRYKSLLVEQEAYLLEVSRYIVLNPVRAGMVPDAGAWPWSSYRATAGLEPAPDWLTVTAILGHFGSDVRQAQRAYREYVQQGVAAESPFGAVHGQIWLGGRDFRARMQARVPRRSDADIPLEQFLPSRPTAEEVLEAVSQAFRVDRDAILAREHREAYRTAVFALRTHAGVPRKDVASLFGISGSRVSQIQRQVESSRRRGGPARGCTLQV